MSWKKFVHDLVINHCNSQGNRTFSLKEIIEANNESIVNFSKENKHPFDKVRQQLQLLRDEKVISFLDNRGTYTLRSLELLEGEVEDSKISQVLSEKPEKREYIIETFARNIGWVNKAKETYGYKCLCNKCQNSFLKKDGTPYIEVHHIIPLCNGGEEGLWNLATVCAHHHRMAHFADVPTKIKLENMLLKEVECRL